ncbi:MAG: PD-(D/E)XK nuclease family protein [Verrucomicrobiota bacterium]
MARVLFYNDARHAWRQTALPWFQFWSREAWTLPQPIVFLAPDSSTIAWIKRLLVKAKAPVVGVEFMTPGVLRGHMRAIRGEAKPLALREDLRLLMELSALELPSNPIAQSTARDPDEFLRQCDQLDSAGWDAEALELPEARDLALHYEKKISGVGLETIAMADRTIARGMDGAVPPFAQILAFGFGSRHAESLNLLRALPGASTSVVYCLANSGDREESLLWRSTMEELGDVDDIPEEVADLPFADWAAAAKDFRHEPSLEVSPEVLVAGSCFAEAAAVVRQIQHWLDQAIAPDRIGIVFARGGLPIAREVTRMLYGAKIAHQDEIGFQPGRSTAHRLFDAWVSYQENADADSARRLFRELRRNGHLSDEDERVVRSGLEAAFYDAMTADLAVLRPLISRQRNGAAASELLDRWPLLSERATFGQFCELVLPVLERIRWPDRLDALGIRSEALAVGLDGDIPRSVFLRWLSEVCRIPGRTRDSLGREAFASVVLTTVERAAGQSWSHLAFVGLCRGDWPPDRSDGIALGPARCAELNRRSQVPSRVGQGQRVLRPEKTWLASVADEQARFNDACYSLLGSVHECVFLSAHLEKADDPGRENDLADWLLRLIFAVHGRLPGENEVRSAAKVHFSEDHEKPIKVPYPKLNRVWRDRRNPNEAFGEYNFGFSECLEEAIALSCKAWEEAVRRPANAWYRYILHLEPSREFGRVDARSRAIGVWAHDWVMVPRGREAFLACPDSDSWVEQTERQAHRVRQQVGEAYGLAGRQLPDWWLMDWSLARRFALQFVESGSGLDWPSHAGEWSLPRRPIKIAGHPLEGLVLSGRIDLLLADASAPTMNELPGAFWPPEVGAWVFDFKTGGDKPLTVKQLQKGEGLQLALYALALHAMGAEKVQVSVVRPGDQVEAQVSLESLLMQNELWDGLRAMAYSGRFGSRAGESSDYAYTGEFPIANIPIKKSILDAQWKLTHPAL